MSWTNYHCHCDFCDGAERPLAYVEAALDRDMSALGFSSHAPLPFPSTWCIGLGRWPSTLERYRTEIDSLRRLYRGRISVWTGLEVDYIPDLIGPSDPAFSGFDYRIGSVHFVGRTEVGLPWQMDDSPASFALGLEEQFGGDIRALVAAYFASVADMARLERPDIIGHFDLVRKYNSGSLYFDEGEAWYRELADAALRAVAASGSILELNTGGMARGYIDEPYPSPRLLGRALELGIPTTINSDSHRSADLDFAFGEAAAILSGLGYERVMVLGSEGWRSEALAKRGRGKPGLRPAA